MKKDPTKMINQPALQTSKGTVWLVVGAFFAILSLVPLYFLVFVNPGPSKPIALGTAISVILLYLLMVIARVAIPQGPIRLRVMAACFLVMAAVALIGVLVAAGSEWSSVRLSI